ncbi:acyltransferase family protein [Methylophaga sp. OBS3]|uniref:acyltransferase family protein n=1 Tax=Methylophaga sp. OBS3 TaxID=2991934 RepID=UPI0022592251|nr:acyltransferase [Methylophaga sp. OBS3]MCX4190242.1 acyltransferase [Methylophaga sp. OBS3]
MDLFQEKQKNQSSNYRINIPKNNNLDLLRFSFAFIVFLVHAYQLSEATSLSLFNDIFSSKVAVECFFVVSGFLIFMSYEYSSNMNRYFEKRFRRIYPAYFSVIIVCAILGSFLSSYSSEEYFLSSELYRYLAANLVFLNFIQPDLPGVFSMNSMTAVNGALWTLKVEVMFYLSVPVFVWLFRKIGLWQGLFLLYASSIIYNVVLQTLINTHGGIFIELQRQLPGQLIFFIAGGALYYGFDFFKKNATGFLLFAIAAYLLEGIFHTGLLYAASLAILVVYFGFIFKFLGNFGKYGDFSYGVYILHFPILQAFIANQFFVISPLLAMLLSSVVVIVTAYVMWHGIEKKMLNKSSHYLTTLKEPIKI